MARITRRSTLMGGFAAVVMSRAALAAPDAVRLTFVLVNDIYKMSEDEGRGGTARLAAVVKAERARGAADGKSVFFAHAGDTLSPSLMSGFDQGAHMIALFNLIHPDIFVPGNHEFDFGPEIYKKRMAEATFPILAANLRNADGSVLSGHKDVLEVEIKTIKLAFIGATLDTTPQLSSPGDLKIAATLETVNRQSKALKAAGADLTIAVVHADKATGQRLMAARAADVILSGHNHDLHIDFDGTAALAESGQDAQYVVAVDIAVSVKGEGGKRKVSWWPNFRIIDTADVTPDPELLARLAAYEGELSKELDVEIATLGEPLDSREPIVRGGEAAIGNLIADALRIENHADIAMINGGGIRAGKQYAAGAKLTRRDILSELPFGNRSVVTDITGKALIAALENGLSLAEQKAGRFPQISGIKVIASLAAPAGMRVQSVEFDGVALDEARLYRVATNDFMLKGGDNYVTLAGAIKAGVDTGGKLVANDVMVYCRSLGTVNAKVEGRMILR